VLLAQLVQVCCSPRLLRVLLVVQQVAHWLEWFLQPRPGLGTQFLEEV
jgi:hypothetical protein